MDHQTNKPNLTTYWFYLFAFFSTLLLSLIIGGLFYQLGGSIFNIDVTASEAVRSLVDDKLKFLVMVVGFVALSTLGTLIAAPLGVCGAIYLECYSPRNWARQLLGTGVDTLTRMPAVIIGLLGFFMVAQFNHSYGWEWNLFEQSFIFALMLLPTVMNTAGIALHAALKGRSALEMSWSELKEKVLAPSRPGVFYGIFIALVRCWCELIITLYVATVALGLLNENIWSQNFGELFRKVAAAGTDTNQPIGKVVIVLILVSVLNAFINWLLKNFALQEIWKAKARNGAQG